MDMKALAYLFVKEGKRKYFNAEEVARLFLASKGKDHPGYKCITTNGVPISVFL